MRGDNRWTKTKQELAEFIAAKELVISSLIEGNYTFKELSQMSGIKEHNIGSLVQNLRRIYNIEGIKYKDKRKRYHITGELEKEEREISLFDTVPIGDLPKKIFKSDLLSWHLQNQIYNVETSTELVKIAKQNGIRVYERNPRGGVYYL